MKIKTQLVLGIRRLNFTCEDCPAPATFEVERSNEGLPRKYIQTGSRIMHYCNHHVPMDAKRFWDSQQVV